MAGPVGPRPQPPTGACKVAVTQHIASTQAAISVFWLKLTSAGAPNTADLNNVLTSVLAAWATAFAPNMSSNVSIDQIDGTWITGAGTAVVGSHLNTTVGALGGYVPNASTCYVLDWLISRYYRGGHPRTYLPGVVSAEVAAGQTITPTRLATIATAMGTFITSVNALTHGDITGTVLGTYSFQTANAWRGTPTFEPYTGAKVRSHLGTQRRRIGGR